LVLERGQQRLDTLRALIHTCVPPG
jgi:hypothetical protein